jgi:hypothetical protein
MVISEMWSSTFRIESINFLKNVFLRSLGSNVETAFPTKCVQYDRHKTLLWKFNNSGHQEDIEIFF